MMKNMDTESWDNEGGYQPLTVCVKCGRLKPQFHDGYCLACWVEDNPPNSTPDKDKDHK